MTQVTHPTFGTGTVISQDDQKVVVDFSGAVKTLAAKFSKLSNLDGTAFGEVFVAPVAKDKKLNAANFMSKEEYAKSKYSTMSKDDFADERENDARNSISW